jgi:RNA polymerase sigma factor (sigma-70 family)
VDGLGAGFEDVFRTEYPGIVRVLGPIVGSVADAESVAQDAFVKAFSRWRRVGGYDRPGAWIQRVAIRDAVRLARRHRPASAGLVAATDPSDDLAVRVDLREALTRWPGRQRACVVLYYLADRPVAEVAETLGCKEATVRVHLHRARAALARSMDLQTKESTDGP